MLQEVTTTRMALAKRKKDEAERIKKEHEEDVSVRSFLDACQALEPGASSNRTAIELAGQAARQLGEEIHKIWLQDYDSEMSSDGERKSEVDEEERCDERGSLSLVENMGPEMIILNVPAAGSDSSGPPSCIASRTSSQLSVNQP